MRTVDGGKKNRDESEHGRGFQREAGAGQDAPLLLWALLLAAPGPGPPGGTSTETTGARVQV